MFRSLRKASQFGRIMASDVGTKRTGVSYLDQENRACSSKINNLVQMCDKYDRPKNDSMIALELMKLLNKHGVKGLVIGMLSGFPPRNGQSEKIKKIYKISILYLLKILQI